LLQRISVKRQVSREKKIPQNPPTPFNKGGQGGIGAKGDLGEDILSAKHYTLYASFLLFLSIGIFLSRNPLAGWYEFLKLIEFVGLGFALKFYFNKYFQWFLWGLTASIFYESTLVIWQFFLQRSIGGFWYFLGERTFSSQTPGIANMSLGGELMLRPYGTFSHPNILAAYLLISLILNVFSPGLLVGERIKKEDKKLNPKPYTLYPIFGLGSFALLLTFSRSVIFLWVVFAGIEIFKFIKRRLNPKPYTLYPITFVFIFLIIVISPLRDRFLFSNFSDESITMRIELIKASLLMIKTNPILGLGFENFFSSLTLFSPILFRTNFIQPVHNIFLLAVSEIGIPGLLFFLWFLWKTFNHLKFQISNFKFQIFLAFIFLGNIDHYFLTLQQGQLLTTVIFAICWMQ